MARRDESLFLVLNKGFLQSAESCVLRVLRWKAYVLLCWEAVESFYTHLSEIVYTHLNSC